MPSRQTRESGPGCSVCGEARCAHTPEEQAAATADAIAQRERVRGSYRAGERGVMGVVELCIFAPIVAFLAGLGFFLTFLALAVVSAATAFVARCAWELIKESWTMPRGDIEDLFDAHPVRRDR